MGGNLAQIQHPLVSGKEASCRPFLVQVVAPEGSSLQRETQPCGPALADETGIPVVVEEPSRKTRRAIRYPQQRQLFVVEADA